MREESANPDREIANLATRQHGVVSSAQLEKAGIDKDGVTRRLRAGRLHRVHRAVYAVGHTKLTFEGRCMAALLAIGDGAVVSHYTAAALWGMLRPTDGPIHITLPGDGGRKRRRGIKVHRSSTFIVRFSISRDGIAVTRPARTLQDLHRSVSDEIYQRAVRRALDLKLIKSADLRREEDLTRSELERLFLALCRRHRLPQPQANARVGPYEVDFLWRDRVLIVETDGFRHHGDRSAFERDRARDAHLQSLGFRVLRFTWRQITDTPGLIAHTLRALLAQPPLSPATK
jgi:very-short-patch-repair endonuclease